MFRVFETKTNGKQTRNYQKELPKNRLLAYFHIIRSKKNWKNEIFKKNFKKFLWETSDILKIIETKPH